MKILILGSEGFVGNNLVEGLSQNHEVSCADLIGNSNHTNYTKIDVTNPSNVENTVKDVDVVIDLVAHSLVSSIEGPVKNAQVNIIGLLNVLEACTKNNIKKIIFTSASSLIGEPKKPQVSEIHPATPKTAYGISKLASEHYLRLYNELNNLNFVIFRFFNIYGPFQKNGLIPSLYSKIKNNQPLTVFGKGDQIRDYVFIKDIIPFFEKAISTSLADNKAFNMGTGKGTRIVDIIEILSKTMNVKPKIEFQPQRPGEIGNFVADTTLLSSTFGKVPSTSVEDGIRETVDWLKKN
jgi:UDP-glucose 4-epimerase